MTDVNVYFVVQVFSLWYNHKQYKGDKMNPENNNQQSASTTVGGVTFGGGLGSAASAQNTTQGSQMPNMPSAGQADVDPIVASTGEEFDAVMNNAQQLPNSSAMTTPVASPTHFDDQKTVKPIVVDPGTPGGFSRQQLQVQETPAPEAETASLIRQVKKASTLSVIFGILTAVFTILAVVGLVYALNSQKEIEDLKKAVDDKQKIVTAVEESTGVAPINTPADVPVYKATTGYIYISEWNIKIKIPDNLDYVSYILNNINYHQSICFNAAQKGVQYFPDFANIALNPGKMGCLTRIPTTEGEFDAATGISFGEKVFTYKDYSYFYTGSIDYSQDAANLGLEHTAAQYIHSMLKDHVEAYE